MFRVLAMVFILVAGAAVAGDDPAGKGAQQQFVNAFLSVRKGEEMERGGDLRGALTIFRSAAGLLAKIKKDHPGWQVELVDFRLQKTMEAIDRVQTKLGGPAAGTGDGVKNKQP